MTTKLVLWAVILAAFSSLSDLAVADEFLFSPEGSQFSVVFPDKPVINESYSAEDDDCITYDAILVLMDGKAGLRAESTFCSNIDIDTSKMVEQDILDELRRHAEISGVTKATFQVQRTEFGFMGSCRGIIASLGNTFSCVLLFGSKSAVMLIGSAPYKGYPTLGFDKFIKSAREVH